MNGRNNRFLSVGIDIGTTTTQMVVSEIECANASRQNQAPRLNIQSRQIIHAGPILFTPLNLDGSIDGQHVANMLAAEYVAAQLKAEQIATGALIVTGESAMLRNASSVAHATAGLAGDFVVASAGPHLESILAGRGSGAAAFSKEHNCTICNVDIGGGTTNVAVFCNGDVIDTACLRLGGRCIRFDVNGTVSYMSDSGYDFVDGVAKRLKPGDTPEAELLELLGYLIAESIVRFFVPGKPPQISQRFAITELLRQDYCVDEFWISGGVAQAMAEPNIASLEFGDIGVYLARGLKESLCERSVCYRIPTNPIRATVLGAGQHSFQLSGSTITVRAENLPLRNLPLVRPFRLTAMTAITFQPLLKECLSHTDLNWRVQPLAIVLGHLNDVSFAALQNLAKSIAASFKLMSSGQPLILLTEQDIGMALGQMLRSILSEDEIVVLDGVAVDTGDYVDVGLAIGNRAAVPVIIKELLFEH